MRRETNVVPVVLAGGRGSRLFELTDRLCKPALPMGSNDRMIDWTMNNLLRSGINKTIVATQYRAQDLATHLSRNWKSGFHKGLHVREGVRCTGRACGYEGTADAVRWNMQTLHKLGADLVLVTAADHIYQMDFAAMVSAHLDSGLPVTVAANIVDKTAASDFGVFDKDENGRIVSFVEKPKDPVEIRQQPGQSLVSMGIYLFDIEWLENALEEGGSDFGHDILPRAYQNHEANCYCACTGDGAPIYWRDVGTLDAFRTCWLTLAREPWTCPSPSGRASRGVEGLLAQGSIALPGAFVSPGARIRNAILTDGVLLGSDDVIGLDADEDEKWFRVTKGGTIVVTPRMLARRSAIRQSRMHMVPSKHQVGRSRLHEKHLL